MLDENEQDALSKIKAYLDAGQNFDAIRAAGWESWIEHLEAKGYDLRTGQLALRPPDESPGLPARPTTEASASTLGATLVRLIFIVLVTLIAAVLCAVVLGTLTSVFLGSSVIGSLLGFFGVIAYVLWRAFTSRS